MLFRSCYVFWIPFVTNRGWGLKIRKFCVDAVNIYLWFEIFPPGGGSMSGIPLLETGGLDSGVTARGHQKGARGTRIAERGPRIFHNGRYVK